ncbi:MAG: hypothetical protein K6U12_09615 [Armatimonadetes bacterium]|nr:hypothetical protein [Armatimonadota bacterium]CUU34307.1 hypothetical protein DCOP10_10719 [Armatimonadetes bacterium DC]
MPRIAIMQIKGVSETMVSAVGAGEPTLKAQAQVKLAKKVLDMQKEQMATLLNQMQGLGQRIDVRV